MNKFFYIIVIISIFFVECSTDRSQKKTIIKGSVVDILTSDPVGGIELIIFDKPSDPNWVITTNQLGEFNLVIPDTISIFDIALELNNSEQYHSYFCDMDKSKIYGEYFHLPYVLLNENETNIINIGILSKCANIDTSVVTISNS